MKWIDKTIEKPDELSGRMIMVFTPNFNQTYRVVRADMWKTMIDSTHWMYLSEPNEEKKKKLKLGGSIETILMEAGL